jgi:hypothetical protein
MFRFRAAVWLPIVVGLCAMPRSGWAVESPSAQAAVAAKQGWSQETRDALGFESAELWTGGSLVTEPKRSGEGAIRWDRHTVNGSLVCLQAPTDLSAFNRMSFWLHSNRASNATFMIILESRSKQDEFSYFSKKVTVDWTGWKQLDFHFRSFGSARAPAGWGKIDRLRCTATGWNQTPTDDAVWVLDDLDFTYSDEPYRPSIDVDKYVTEPARDDFLKHLRREHPRLILLDEDLPRIKAFVSSDPRGKAWYENARRTAEALYARPVSEHQLPDGRRLLSVSREVLNRIYHWGFFYRMEGDRKWLDRAWQEIQAVVDFPDWNPSHYLDTAEMMHAIGIGYDWFYRDLTDAQRKTIRDGLWQHGLRLSYAAYMGLPGDGSQGWRSVENNWNFVCNGGSSLAALAVLDEMPQPCSEILHAAFQYIQIPLHHFEPDGAWWEGIGYWGYSMRYLLAYLQALQTACGTDFGFVEALRGCEKMGLAPSRHGENPGKSAVAKVPVPIFPQPLRGTGFSQAGDFPVYLVSPLGGIYNFADSGSGGGTYQHWGLFYLADKFRNPLYQHFQEQATRGTLDDILYYRPLPSELAIGDVPLDKHFRVTEVATMRSAWTDRDALFVGIKCGRNGIAHAHQDLGSFVFYGLGEPWLIDLGTERQTYLAHQHRLPKSAFYRIREEGHNTLVFNPDKNFSQDPRGHSQIVRFESSPDEVFAIADLTDAYRQHADCVKRGYRLLDDRRALLVQDEIQSQRANELWWFAHGGAGIKYVLSEDGRRVTLARNGKTCYVSLLTPAEAKFTVMDAQPLPTSPNPGIQNPNKGLRKLAVHLPDAKNVTLAVLLMPANDTDPEPALQRELTPLDAWKLPPATTRGGEPSGVRHHPSSAPEHLRTTAEGEPESLESVDFPSQRSLSEGACPSGKRA